MTTIGRSLGAGDERRLVDIDEFVGGGARDDRSEHGGLPRTVLAWLTTTDHKALGVAYVLTSLFFLAVGGVLGGGFTALLAPLVFDSVLEYPLLLLAACLLSRICTRLSLFGARLLVKL